ncbi:MAG: SUF system Fe-S cluster assembly regulator [Acidobacteria bacterium]|nr:MAG: SUF system Fe-S cluster assembly regulator [Acidobacteriota bacterium]
MLSIPKEMDYGILILLELTQARKNQVIAATKMAEKTGLPYQHVAKLMKKLQRGGVLESVMGPKGGYRLQQLPEEITLNDIYNVLFGKVSLTDCTRDHSVQKGCLKKNTCSLVPHVTMINQIIKQEFSRITLSKLNEKNVTSIGV